MPAPGSVRSARAANAERRSGASAPARQARRPLPIRARSAKIALLWQNSASPPHFRRYDNRIAAGASRRRPPSVKILCVFSARDEASFVGAGQSSFAPFVHALRRLGHDVGHVDSGDRSAWTDFAAFNRDLVLRVMQERPDAVLFAHDAVEVWVETLDLLRESCDTLLIRWSSDAGADYASRMRPVIPHFDLFVTTSLMAMHLARRDAYANAILSQWAADAETLVPPLKASECDIGVSYVGPATPRRVRWIRALKARGIDVECYGPGWPGRLVEPSDLAAIVRRSLLSIDFARRGSGLRGLRVDPERPLEPRTFEIPALGGMLISEAGEALKRYFRPDEEIGVFASVEELEALIRRFRLRPDLRDAAAHAAFERVRAQHTYDQRLAEVLGAIRKIGPALVTQVADNDKVMKAFDGFARGHRAGWAMRALRQALILPLMPVLGARRARHAARSAVFAASLKIQGARTFSAAGLPGRLFYR